MLIHVGLHKCASTWLQRNLFTRVDAGFCAPWGPMSHRAVSEFVAIDPLLFDAGAVRDRFDEARRGTCEEGQVPVLSHEALSSRPHHGSYYAREVALRLKETFPEAKLLMVFREQISMIGSLYGEHVRNGGRHTLREFIGAAEVADGFAPLCRFSFFEYDRLLEMYREVFGPDRVLALPLELLRGDPDAFVGRIFALADLSPTSVDAEDRPNVSWGPATVELYRRSNGLIRRSPLGLPDGPLYRVRRRVAWRLDRLIPRRLNAGMRRNQAKMVRETAGDVFRNSNRRLAHATGFALAALGYPT